MLKRILSFAFTAIFISLFLTANAAGGAAKSDWTNLPGFTYYFMDKDTKRHPMLITETAQGLNVKCDGFYKTGVKEYSGIILNNKVNLDGFSIEFKANTLAGNSDDGDDLWIGIALLEKKNGFDTLDTSFNQGMVSLIRPNTRDINISLHEHVGDFKFNGNGVRSAADWGQFKPKDTLKVEFKKNSDGTYNYYVNGKLITGVFRQLGTAFPDGKAYLYFGLSTNSGEMWDVTISKINGVSLGTGASSSSGSSSSSTSQSSSSNTSSSNSSTVNSGSSTS